MDPLSWEGNFSRFRKTLLNGGGGGYFVRIFLRMRVILILPEGMLREMLSTPPFRYVTKGGKFSGGR